MGPDPGIVMCQLRPPTGILIVNEAILADAQATSDGGGRSTYIAGSGLVFPHPYLYGVSGVEGLKTYRDSIDLRFPRIIWPVDLLDHWQKWSLLACVAASIIRPGKGNGKRWSKN